MRAFLRNNSLSVVTFGLFFLTFIVGQTLTGQREYNASQKAHGDAGVDLVEYLGTGHFREATFENWESEFLQMGTYVLLTVWLRQRGSSESKPVDEATDQDEDPLEHQNDEGAPWPVRRGGLVLALYKNSLSIAFFLLFAASLVLHANGGVSEYNREQVDHGEAPITAWEYATTARFWFESLQNWQSEFLAVGAIVVLTIFLRQKGSPESKPVHAPHAQTGS